MKRRGITVVLGAALVALLTWQALSMDVAYVAMGPGPTQDVLTSTIDDDNVEHQIITAENGYETSGELRLTTVRVKSRITLAEALRYWMSNDQAVVPRNLIYPPDQSQEEITAEQEADWIESQSNAEQAALAYLGEPAELRVAADSQGLRTDDIVLTVDGTDVTELEQLEDYADSETTLTVDRAGQEETVEGVLLSDVELEQTHQDPYGIEIDTEALDIGGPSAGLIFAIGIVDRVTEEDLVAGHEIAGTGEIDPEGNVGPIGGIQQKIAASDQEGVELFLSPAANCSDAVSAAPEDMTIVRVETLEDAIEALQSYTAGEEVQTC